MKAFYWLSSQLLDYPSLCQVKKKQKQKIENKKTTKNHFDLFYNLTNTWEL